MQLSQLGHVMCMRHERLPKLVLEWELDDSRRRCRDGKMWISRLRRVLFNLFFYCAEPFSLVEKMKTK